MTDRYRHRTSSLTAFVKNRQSKSGSSWPRSTWIGHLGPLDQHVKDSVNEIRTKVPYEVATPDQRLHVVQAPRRSTAHVKRGPAREVHLDCRARQITCESRKATLAQQHLVRDWYGKEDAKTLHSTFPFASACQSNRNDTATDELATG